MMVYEVIDSDMRSVLAGTYDIAFFASGYEERCTHIPKMLARAQIVDPVILGFEELKNDVQRNVNNNYFTNHWLGRQERLSADDDTGVYSVLQNITSGRKGAIRILVDYSSMSRVWYAAVLNWARFTRQFTRVSIDLLYSVGSHQDSLPPMVINDIVSIPGCEGGTAPVYKSTAVFGLGFEGLAALCVLDRLEPDEVYAYLAAPAAFPDYPERARAANHELVECAEVALELPLSSVQQTYNLLSELVSPNRAEAEVVLIPMGPKPHVLAAILLAMRFEEIGCLRVSGKRTERERVQATGEIVVTSVSFQSGPINESMG